MFGEASFTASTKYLCMLIAERQDKPRQAIITTRTFEAYGPVRAVKIVEALTAATRPEDLAEAFAWFENALPAQDALRDFNYIFGGKFNHAWMTITRQFLTKSTLCH